MLVDRFGREIRSTKPVIDEIAVSSVRDRYFSYPSNGLTPERLATILKEADQGDVYRQSELFEEMEEKDLDLGGDLQTRKLAVMGLEYEILPASTSAQDKKIGDAAKEMFDYIENWRDAVLDMMDAVGKGFAVQEILWDLSQKTWWIKTLNWIHQKRFTFTGPATQVGSQTINPLLNYPRLITDKEQVYGEELLPYKFVFHRHKARSGATSRGGLSRPCAYMYLFKNYDIKDWLVFNELYSVPMRLGKYKPGATPDDITKLKQAVFNLGVDAAAVISDSTIIELLESKVRGETSAFKDLAEFCTKGMTKIILGHSSASESTPGKLGNEEQATKVRQDLLEADAESVMNTVKFQLLQPWVFYNFGPDAGVPKFRLLYKQGEDLEKTARVYGVLVKDVNFKGIPASHIYDRFNIPEPQDGEETVSAAPQGFGIGDSSLATANSSRITHHASRSSCSCGHDHAVMINADTNPDQKWVDEYMAKMQGALAEVKGQALDEITAWMKSLSAMPSEEEFTSKVQGILAATYGAIDTAAAGDVIATMYSSFATTGSVRASIAGPDLRTMSYLEKLDNFYLSKWIENPDSVAAVRNFISEHYLDNAAGIFGRTADESIQKFRDLFSQKLGDLSDGQIQRIIDTSVQRTRNWAHLQQVHKIGRKSIRIIEPTKECDFCAAMNNKVIDVSAAYDLMTRQMTMSPEEYAAGFAEPDYQPTLNNIANIVDRGMLPPYHPHCHGSIVVS